MTLPHLRADRSTSDPADGEPEHNRLHPPVDRLSTADLMMLRSEDVGWRQDIGAVAILDGASLLAADGALDLERVRSVVASRLHLVPRLRHVLHIPKWWLGRPLWVDASAFRIDDHVRAVQLASGSGQTELLAEVERLRARPFDRGRPLWELWLLPGLPDQQVGLYVKLHHTVADGVAGVALLASLLDLEPIASLAPSEPWSPGTRPTSRDLFVDNVRHIVCTAGGTLAGLLHPVAAARRLAGTIRMMQDAFGQDPAPLTSANQPIGEARVLALVRTRLELFKTIAHPRGATVNDVLMVVIAGGYRALLTSRGEAVDDLVLRASVPVSLHDDVDGKDDKANDDGMMFVPLPVGIEDPVRRLETIAAATAVLKQQVAPALGGLLMSTRLAQDAFWRRFDHQRWSNAYAANVPGPPLPLYFAGALVREVFPVVPIMGNLTIGVGAISYDGQYNITVVADETTCPDVQVFSDGMEATIERLVSSTAGGAGHGLTLEPVSASERHGASRSTGATSRGPSESG